MDPIIYKILSSMAISKPQQNFISHLFELILAARGKINFRNLSRYSRFDEKTFSRQFRKAFSFSDFNQKLIEHTLPKKTNLAIAYDPSFIKKSGKKTYGLGSFFNSCASTHQKGLEVSVLALVDLDSNQAYTLSAKQTPPIKKTEDSDESRIDHYLQHLKSNKRYISEEVKYLLADGYFAKTKYVNEVIELGFHLISKLRKDANLRFLYNGKQKEGRGRKRKYSGKVEFDDLRKFDFICEVEEGVKLYSKVVYHMSFKRKVKLAMLVKFNKDGTRTHTLLFSTDLNLSAEKILKYYKSRYQIEFLFRDGKQFTGLGDCQARNRDSLNYHFNASLSALNIAKLKEKEEEVFSMYSFKQRALNKLYMDFIFSKLGLFPDFEKKHFSYLQCLNFGSVAS